MATPWSKTYKAPNHTFRKYREGDNEWSDWESQIFDADHSYKCPTYVHRTPPCQGSCPAGEDVRGWLQIVRGIEQPPEGVTWQEYAFQRATDANPFPSQMGRVCPAPCESGCNRNEVEDFVGINSVEMFIGDNAISEGYKFAPAPALNGQTVAVIGGGPAGLTAAYQLRRRGYACCIFDYQEQLGGMMRYGIPGYRTPRGQLDAEIERILALGDIEFRANVRVGKDVSIAQLEVEFAAVIWTVGCQVGRAIPVPGGDAPNCVSGVKFLEAYNSGRLHVSASKVVCVGGGDTSIDVVSVARRLGHISTQNPAERPELVVHGFVAHDAAQAAFREGAQVVLTSLFSQSDMTAAEHEVHDALTEGVDIHDGVMPVEVLLDDDGRACAIRLARCTLEKGVPTPIDGTEYEVECDLVVAAIGQGGDLDGLNDLDNGRGLIDADAHFALPNRPGHFAAGDIIRPHLLTTAIGQASIAVDSVDRFLNERDLRKRPKVDVHHFNLLNKLRETGLEPGDASAGEIWGTDDSNVAIHNYEDRSSNEIVPADQLFLAHFPNTPRNVRSEMVPSATQVLGHFEERIIGLSDEQARAEADRCMSCGMCFECDSCVIFCPQDAVFRVKKDQRTMGRYVDTDYTKCIGCHICADVCPSGYIDMGLGA